MAISFAAIPPNLRVPLAYFELDNTMASTQQQEIQNALLLGTVPVGAALAEDTPTIVFSADQVRSLCGAGSALGRQAERWFQNNASVPLYILAAREDASYTPSEGDITWTGPATGSGTIPLYIGGRRCPVTVTNGMTAAQIATAVADAINANPRLGVGAAVDTVGPPATPTVTDITALQAGILGGIDINIGLAGAAGAEAMPPGVTAVVTRMTGSTGSPDVGELLANIGDAAFDFVMCPYNSHNDLNDLDDFFNDVTGRWAWSQQLYGHGFTAYETRIGGLSTFGRLRNGQHVTVMGYFGSPTPHDEWIAAYVGAAAGSLIVDPARPVQSLPLLGVWAPPKGDRFTILERQVIYFDGISSYYALDDGTVRIDRLITTYQRNVWGAPDNSYLDVETMFTAQYFNRFMKQRVQLKFPRHKLASDGTRFGVGQAIVTPRIIKAEMIAAYAELEEAGLMENMEGFKRALIVERNATDPNRVDVLLPPDFVNQLRVFAALVQFRLQGTDQVQLAA